VTSVIFTVGNSLRADDGAGPLLAELLEAEPAAEWQVIDGGAAPENCMHQVRALGPQRVIIVDAADMRLAPGEVRLIEESCVAEQFLVSTHSIPLNYLIASLRETIPEVFFVGIQPKGITFFGPMSPEVRGAVEGIHRCFREGKGIDAFRPVAEASNRERPALVR
jgi:hydrogenase 3 maturation protease